LSTWMVVEDEPDIYEVLLAMFEMWGIDGVAFVDGEEAVTWIEDVDSGRYNGELPELALIDIRLPGKVDGAMVGERIRESSILGDIAIVMSTAYKLSKEEEEEVVERAGADKLMYKPMPRFDELQRILEKVIAARREANAAAAEAATEDATDTEAEPEADANAEPEKPDEAVATAEPTETPTPDKTPEPSPQDSADANGKVNDEHA